MPVLNPESTDYPLGVTVEDCPSCSVRFTQDVNHCSFCHSSFDSWSLYTLHRKKGPRCYKPSEMLNEDGERVMKIGKGGAWTAVS